MLSTGCYDPFDPNLILHLPTSQPATLQSCTQGNPFRFSQQWEPTRHEPEFFREKYTDDLHAPPGGNQHTNGVTSPKPLSTSSRPRTRRDERSCGSVFNLDSSNPFQESPYVFPPSRARRKSPVFNGTPSSARTPPTTSRRFSSAPLPAGPEDTTKEISEAASASCLSSAVGRQSRTGATSETKRGTSPPTGRTGQGAALAKGTTQPMVTRSRSGSNSRAGSRLKCLPAENAHVRRTSVTRAPSATLSLVAHAGVPAERSSVSTESFGRRPSAVVVAVSASKPFEAGWRPKPTPQTPEDILAVGRAAQRTGSVNEGGDDPFAGQVLTVEAYMAKKRNAKVSVGLFHDRAVCRAFDVEVWWNRLKYCW